MLSNYELAPTGVRVRGRVGISFKLRVIVLPILPLFLLRMRTATVIHELSGN